MFCLNEKIGQPDHTQKGMNYKMPNLIHRNEKFNFGKIGSWSYKKVCNNKGIEYPEK